LLAHFSTADTARDMDLLRQATGDQKLNYIGISYGTYVGAVYANLFPAYVGKMILDGVVDPVAYNAGGDDEPDLSTGQRLGSDIGIGESLSAFLDQCAQAKRPSCAFATESVAETHAKIDSLLHRLKNTPTTYKGFVFTPALLLTTANNDLFYTRPIAGVAAGWVGFASVLEDIWKLTEQGEAASSLVQPADVNTLVTASNAEEAYASPFQQAAVECPESPNPRPPSVFRKLAHITVARAGLVGLATPWTDELCASWPATAADNYTGPWSNPTANTILVVGNTHDPSTPLHNAEALIQELASARLLTVDGYGHTELLNSSACAGAYEDSYLIDGSLPPAGTVCSERTTPF
jgi:pimeloyl-ACP methyl ester carboxylesterase